ncbi:Uncharacterised protein [Mycobacterium tuberculosis]|nr:Uncharacterised protein [Mycobacterium tuberculosis]
MPQPLAKLFPIPIRIALVDLGTQVLRPVGHRFCGAAAVDNDRVVLADHHASGRAQHLQAHLAQHHAGVGVDHLATRHHRQVLKERLTAVTEVRPLDRDRFQRLANRVDDQRRQRFALHVFSHDQ